MSIVTPKIDAQYLTSLLVKKTLIHWHTDHLRQNLFAVGLVAAWFANTREQMPVVRQPNWRGLIVANPFGVGCKAMEYAKANITTPGFRMWNHAALGRNGTIRAVSAEPASVDGIVGSNLLFIVLNNQDKSTWAGIWNAVAADTTVLAVNCELFAQWNEFEHIG